MHSYMHTTHSLNRIKYGIKFKRISVIYQSICGLEVVTSVELYRTEARYGSTM